MLGLGRGRRVRTSERRRKRNGGLRGPWTLVKLGRFTLNVIFP